MRSQLAKLTLLFAAFGTGGFAQNRACQLLTVNEIRSATRLAFLNAEPSTTRTGDTICAYSTQKGDRFTITVTANNGKDTFANSKGKALKKERGDFKTLSGMGDDAFLLSGGPVTSIFVLKATPLSF